MPVYKFSVATFCNVTDNYSESAFISSVISNFMVGKAAWNHDGICLGEEASASHVALFLIVLELF